MSNQKSIKGILEEIDAHMHLIQATADKVTAFYHELQVAMLAEQGYEKAKASSAVMEVVAK